MSDILMTLPDQGYIETISHARFNLLCFLLGYVLFFVDLYMYIVGECVSEKEKKSPCEITLQTSNI